MVSAENFIPWEQIEPLLTPDMTAEEFRDVLRAKVGLPPDTYGVITQMGMFATLMPWRDALRNGLKIVRRESREFQAARPMVSESPEPQARQPE